MVVKKALRTCQAILLYAGILGIVIGGVHILIDVTVRYVVGVPVPGAMESSSMLLAVAATAFFTVTELEDMHVRSTLLLDRLPATYRQFLTGVYNIATAVVALFLWYCVWLDAGSSKEFGDLSDVLLLPLHYVKYACAIAILAFCVVLIGRGVRRIVNFQNAGQHEI